MLSLERVLLVPSGTPPHKVGTAGAPLASAQQRLEWTRKAVASRPGLEADDLELRRDGPSYTVDTVREIARRSGEPPVFIIGDDAFSLFSTWRAPEQLLALCHFAVMTRPPGVAGSLHDWLPASAREHVEFYDEGRSARHREAGTWIRIVPIDALAISSSDVRARLREGRSVRYLIPEEVRSEVESSGVYAGPSAAEAGAHS
jgi:nicotinate-nucleotide adenylyltransferase